MKALSGRVRILKNSKLKLRVGLKKRDAMTSDSKDKTEGFLSGVVEGNRVFFNEKARQVSLRAWQSSSSTKACFYEDNDSYIPLSIDNRFLWKTVDI